MRNSTKITDYGKWRKKAENVFELFATEERQLTVWIRDNEKALLRRASNAPSLMSV